MIYAKNVHKSGPTDWPAQFFRPTELACRHCGELMVDEDALMRLDALRSAVGRPVAVVSGYRCPVHNAAVGGAQQSFHLKGRAFDLPYDLKKPLHVILRAGMKAGFTGFGFYTGFLHVDVGPSRAWVG